jgi:L,D-peptidoglycan transpeptidase YkuD (ErfK/YbiS/YcfS/YnhG family)
MRLISHILVIADVRNRSQGTLIAGQSRHRCAIGRAGFIVSKREGDGGTPVARLPLRRAFLRPDKGPAPLTRQPRRWTTRTDAWCDDMGDRRYNRLIPRPIGLSAGDQPNDERLWRADHLYDVIVELGWNDAPVRRGLGSAIFWHLPRPGHTPTAGCVATARDVFHKVLPGLARNAVLIAGPVKPRPVKPRPVRRKPR